MSNYYACSISFRPSNDLPVSRPVREVLEEFEASRIRKDVRDLVSTDREEASNVTNARIKI